MQNRNDVQLLDTLAERAGIAPDYYDIQGRRHIVCSDTKRAILLAMGFAVDSEEALAKGLTHLEETAWNTPCEAAVIQQETKEGQWSLRLPLDGIEEPHLRVAWQVRDEANEIRYQREEGPSLTPQEVKYIGGERYARFVFPLPASFPPGYYDVSASAKSSRVSLEGRFRLIVAPPHCYVPPCLEHSGRIWGLAVQVYSLRSATNWGAGDFSDLRDLTEWAGKDLGASLIGVNPLHALKNSRPHHLSPYAPNSRLFLNELYIDVERLPEFHASSDARQARSRQAFQDAMAAARKSDRVDYDAVATAKRTMLDWAYRQFLRDNYSGTEPALKPTTPRGWLLERFIRDGGEALERYAIFQALEEERRLLEPQVNVWQDWPQQYRSPASPAVREFGRRHRKRVRFFQYIQWIASDQLKDVGARASASGMEVGLYRDLALGSDRCGAEGWMLQDVLALSADCGAPPDAFAPQGQNWGLPPFNPLRLKATGYAAYIQLLRKNLHHGGALRLDHVMALFRLFWVPRGLPASAGAYVQYPSADLLAILALESMRARTLVIGEDLGTVPDGVREELARWKILSYRVFYFERHDQAALRPPAEYPEQSLAVVTTHDLPTLSGYWSGEDIQLRAGLGIYADEAARQQAWDERQRDKAAILAALKAEALLPAGLGEDLQEIPRMTAELCRAIHGYLAKSSASVVLANIDDLIGEVSQMNLPGTFENYPNWSRKLSLSLDELRRDERIRQVAAMMRALRPSAHVGS